MKTTIKYTNRKMQNKRRWIVTMHTDATNPRVDPGNTLVLWTICKSHSTKANIPLHRRKNIEVKNLINHNSNVPFYGGWSNDWSKITALVIKNLDYLWSISGQWSSYFQSLFLFISWDQLRTRVTSNFKFCKGGIFLLKQGLKFQPCRTPLMTLDINFTQCVFQVFHVCALTDDGLIMKSFLCPESTLFDQTILKCNWWFYVDCKNSKKLYDSNIPISKSYQLMKALTFFSSYKTDSSNTPKSPDEHWQLILEVVSV